MIQSHIETLKQHNHWRRCNDDDCKCEMTNPAELGEAIDAVIKQAQMGEQAIKVLNQIASKTRKTKEQRLANACVLFLESLE